MPVEFSLGGGVRSHDYTLPKSLTIAVGTNPNLEPTSLKIIGLSVNGQT